jgi:hypothetical protein
MTGRVQADHAVVEAGASTMRTGLPSPRKSGAAAAGSRADADLRAGQQAARPVLRRAATALGGVRHRSDGQRRAPAQHLHRALCA